MFLKLHSVAKLLALSKPRQSITQSDSGAEPNIFGETFGNPQIPSKLESALPKAVSERALDIAIGREIPIHEPTELIAMVRQLQSDGLARILEDDKDFTVGAEDIRSKPVTLEFSVGRNGKPSPLDLAISVTAPDFEPTSQSKSIRIPPFADSETCTFLLTPRQLGELRVTVELYTGNVALLSRLLRTHAKTSDRLPLDLARVVLHVPLTVLVRPEWSVAEDNIREVVSRYLAEVRNLHAS